MFKGLMYQFSKRKDVIPLDTKYINWLITFDDYIQARKFINAEKDLDELCDKVFDYAIKNDLATTREAINLIRWCKFVRKKNIDVELIDKKTKELNIACEKEFSKLVQTTKPEKKYVDMTEKFKGEKQQNE